MRSCAASLACLAVYGASAASTVIINEVADKGDYADSCVGSDWIELHNPTESALPLGGLVLSDDKGPADDDALTLALALPLRFSSFIRWALTERDLAYASGCTWATWARRPLPCRIFPQ